MAQLQAELERDIVKDFENGFTPDGILIGNVGQLSNACLVIEVLGEDVRWVDRNMPPQIVQDL